MAKPEIVILTGAGISAESGIRTFRDANGLWEKHRIEDVATPEGFERNPRLVHTFYNERRRQLLEPTVKPNPAHEALVKLEREYARKKGGDVLVITQNIDNLHERAGTQNLLHMHGELLKARCSVSGKVYEVHADIFPETPCECCQCAGSLRPHVVWFGEVPLFLDEIEEALKVCKTFISIGTSGLVYPAADFVEVAKQNSATQAIEVNLEETGRSPRYDVRLIGPAGELVPALVQQLLND